MNYLPKIDDGLNSEKNDEIIEVNKSIENSNKKIRINIGDIESYFQFLLKYDSIIASLKKDYGEENLEKEDGVIKKPKSFSIARFIPLREIFLHEIEILDNIYQKKDNPEECKKFKEIIKNYHCGDIEDIIHDLLCRIDPELRGKKRPTAEEKIREQQIDKIGQIFAFYANDAVRKQYHDAYKKAAELIRAAPNGIYFTPIRRQQRTKK